MQVEFLSASAPYCIETGCSIFDCDSEHVFHVWAGYGTVRSDVEWVGHNVRFPTEGEIRVCGRESCSSTEDWSMEGNDRYIFEFVMPASDNLYVLVTGEEQEEEPLGCWWQPPNANQAECKVPCPNDQYSGGSCKP